MADNPFDSDGTLLLSGDTLPLRTRFPAHPSCPGYWDCPRIAARLRKYL